MSAISQNLALIICTYMRSESLKRLLDSIAQQKVLPQQILVIDGSNDNLSEQACRQANVAVSYFQVPPEHRGLTKQRNFGIEKVLPNCEIVAFLDDDVVLNESYFEEILKTFTTFPEAVAVGGAIENESDFTFVGLDYKPKSSEFYYDGFVKKDSQRFILRKKFGLDSDLVPGFMPEVGHGRSISFLPLSQKTYPAELLMGCAFSVRSTVFKNGTRFSTFFEGYGLYEDAHFCVELAKTGPIYLNTAALLIHLHEPSGRPNQYKYGKMVVRNGWFVWRTKYPHPSFKNKFKWHVITLLLMYIRFTNVLNTKQREAAFTEFLGRKISWINVLLGNKPKLE